MPKTKLPPELEARLAYARRCRLEQAAARGLDPREHPDAETAEPGFLDPLVAIARKAARRPERRRSDLDAARAKRERRRQRFRGLAARGNLPGHRTDELASAFSDEELREVLLTDHEAREAKRERYAQAQRRAELEAETKRVLGEQDAERRQEAEQEARRRLGAAS